MKQASSCPQCGAPIYTKEQKHNVPVVFFTCDCRMHTAVKPADEDRTLFFKLLKEEWEEYIRGWRMPPVSTSEDDNTSAAVAKFPWLP